MNNDLISREALWKKAVRLSEPVTILEVLRLIDNAPTVEYPFYQEAYQTGFEEGKNERPQYNIHDFIAKADESTLFQLKKEIENALTKIAEREAYEEARREAMRLDEADGTLKGRGYA